MSSARAFGDPERHLVRLSRGLAGRGHDVFVALRPTSEWQRSLDFLPAANILHISVRNSFGMFSARAIARFIDENRIDIVHAHAAKDYIAGSLVRRVADNVRLVLTRHVDRPLKPFHRFALRNVDAAIAVSPSIHKQLALTFRADKLFTIPNGIEFEDVEPAAAERKQREFRAFHGIPGDVPLVAAIGELKVTSGQRDLVLAAVEIIKKVASCHFVFAGSDRSAGQKFRRELKRLVKVLELDRNVTWLEQTDDVDDLIAAADLLISPSHLQDLTMSTIDAMAVGKVVITTATDEIIAPRATVQPKDPLALADAIVLFLSDDELLRETGNEAKAAVRERFSLARMIDETEQVYRHILSR